MKALCEITGIGESDSIRDFRHRTGMLPENCHGAFEPDHPNKIAGGMIRQCVNFAMHLRAANGACAAKGVDVKMFVPDIGVYCTINSSGEICRRAIRTFQAGRHLVL